MFMQDLWRSKLDWDANLPRHTAGQLQDFRDGLRDLTAIQLPRWFHWTTSSSAQLYAFADASRRAITATIYLRTKTGAGAVRITLIAAKTKLNPLRNLSRLDQPPSRMTIPRLQLHTALLAVRLLRFASSSLEVPRQDCYGWSDSRIVLHWLESDGLLDNDLVDNYVSQIQELAPQCRWRYVRSAENPADIATRGSDPLRLSQTPLWWSGPSWLSDPVSDWPVDLSQPQAIVSTMSHLTRIVAQPPQVDVSVGFSNLNRLLRALVHCRRLFRRHADRRSTVFDPITADELDHVFLHCIRRSQQHYYAAEIKALESGQPVAMTSVLRTLLPFLDESKILRVGGRLGDSALSFSAQHPPILHGKCGLSDLVINWAHTRALHGASRVTYAYTMQRAWIIGGKVRVKAHVRRCMVCAKSIARALTRVMAPLPASRVTSSRPFSRCGVDYAGPFQVLSSNGRGIRSSKGYVAVFLCLSTKAIHLELVGDLSTASFLGALTRFLGRRGKPEELWSDNATNFRGADVELRRLLAEAVPAAMQRRGRKEDF